MSSVGAAQSSDGPMGFGVHHAPVLEVYFLDVAAVALNFNSARAAEGDLSPLSGCGTGLWMNGMLIFPALQAPSIMSNRARPIFDVRQVPRPPP